MSSPLRLFPQDEPVPPRVRAVVTFVTHQALNGAHATTIGRTWEVKTHRTCGSLCAPEFGCNFTEGHCQVGIDAYVPDDLCPTFKRS